MKHQIERHRHEIVRRTLTVSRTERVTPGMLRLFLTGDELAGFTSLSPDDHLKLLVPGPDGEPVRRDYTPRRYDAASGELSIDFALHEAGPATQWAMAARPGDAAQIGGPRGSLVVAQDFDWWLLIGDETALPAIGRRLEELPAGAAVTTIVAVSGAAEEAYLPEHPRAAHRAIWVHRPLDRADDPAPILAALAAIDWPEGDGFVWVAAEASVARAVRNHVAGRGHPEAWMRASGYWKVGAADAHEEIRDTPPPA